jgi:hypothetical protein
VPGRTVEDVITIARHEAFKRSATEVVIFSVDSKVEE